MLLTVLFTAVSINAQSTTIKLSTANNTSDFSVTDSAATPTTLSFKLNGDGSLFSKGTYVSGTTAPSLGAGTRMWWFPEKGAFRVGSVGSTQWDGSNVGDFSFASGYNTTANKIYSTAMGYHTTASGKYSTAMGAYTTASGYSSTAMGSYVSTNSNSGSFIIGDNSTSGVTTLSNAANQMMMRFADGGYIFYTNSAANVGVSLAANQSSWSTTSDSTKKYAFLPVNGERVLSKIDKFNLRSWSYKGQDSTKFRHYGPMAQEFFNAFGHDKYGVAGNDTTINQADFEGINLIAIQALGKRTDELKSVQKELENKTEKLALLKQKVDEQQKQIALQEHQFNELNKMKMEFTVFKKSIISFMNTKNNGANSKIVMNK